jgi:hypothetical protein
MFPELIQQLIDKNQYPLLLADDVNAFIGTSSDIVCEPAPKKFAGIGGIGIDDIFKLLLILF